MDWKDILEQEFYVHWIDYIEHEYPELKGHAFDTYIHNRDQLSKLVKEHREIVVQKVASQINSSIIRPDITSGLSHAYKEHDDLWSALLDELNKKKHILPVRKLIEHYEPTILKISPCWLATPSAVSSIFPLKRNIFDLIIFDEASQSPVADSLTSLYRGKKVVIIGDEKQLRPSDLFELKEDEYEVDEDIDRTLLSESLLTLANRAFNYTYLRWHYRSAFQELIDFSNHAFYEGRLKIAPNILRGVTPMRWIASDDGVWLDRKNVPEAIHVVDELKGIFITNKINGTNRSVGIITFNYQQRVEIENEIDRRRQKDLEFDKLYSEIDDPETRNLDDLPFVKNIENVQGDERDIIIFSLGYAKDLENPEDTIGVQFGALNRQDGENRLNVAITRARQEIVILCSFDPYRIKADDAQYDGPKRLKDYLCYAKSISESNIENTRKILSSLDRSKNSESFSPVFDEKLLEVLVREKLQKLGYQLDLKVGYSDYKIDLAVVDPDNPSKYILAIETDGESFTSANSTIERDIIRQDFLESRGWRVERIWSRNWWRNSDEEMGRIRQKIEEIRHSDNSIANEKSNITTSQSTIREILSKEQKFEESSSSITPQTPFSNKIRYRKALESCEGYIHWIDKWFSAYGLEILSDCNIKNINEIKILTSDLRVDTKLRDTIIDFSKEFENRGIVCEMRVLNNREIYRALHDRWILSKNICFNLPSPDIVARGQYSEIKQTTSRPPFEQWWINSLDIVTDWNEIARMIIDRRQKAG